MKTLEQIEPRTPISELPRSIRSPGSYYVTDNLTGVIGQHGITIDADNVTLDLNGFTLWGGGGGGGIVVLGTHRHITIKNGSLREWGGDGIGAGSASHSRFANLYLWDNTLVGLRTGEQCLVENCQTSENGDDGIWIEGAAGQVRNCVSADNSGNGISVGRRSQVLDSVSSGNSTGLVATTGSTVARCTVGENLVHGIVVGGGSVVKDCTAALNTQIGIAALEGCSVLDCNAVSNSTDGIQVKSDCLVRGNTCDGNGFAFFGAGVHATGSRNRIEDNHLTGADRGLWIVGTDNYVAGNTVLANGENYAISAGNQLNLLLSEIPETIAWPAMVELAGTLTGEIGEDGITIDADQVTIDMKGHSLLGVAGSEDGITVVNTSPDHKNITIQNGTLRDWDGHGLFATYCSNSVARSVNAIENGLNGIEVDDEWIVENCKGIHNGLIGINVSDNSIVYDCVATFNGSNGIKAASVCTVRDNVTQRNGASGIRVGNDNLVTGNLCDDNDRDGIRLTSGDNRVEENHVTDNEWRGIAATSSGALIIRNTAAGNDTNYFFAANNRYGPIVDVDSVNGDISGTANSDHPWANFEF